MRAGRRPPAAAAMPLSPLTASDPAPGSLVIPAPRRRHPSWLVLGGGADLYERTHLHHAEELAGACLFSGLDGCSDRFDGTAAAAAAAASISG